MYIIEVPQREYVIFDLRYNKSKHLEVQKLT